MQPLALELLLAILLSQFIIQLQSRSQPLLCIPTMYRRKGLSLLPLRELIISWEGLWSTYAVHQPHKTSTNFEINAKQLSLLQKHRPDLPSTD